MQASATTEPHAFDAFIAEGDAYDRLDDRAKAAQAYREAMKAARTSAETRAAREKLQGVNYPSILERIWDRLKEAMVTVVVPGITALVIFLLVKGGVCWFGVTRRKAGMIAIQSEAAGLPASYIEGALRAVQAEIREQTVLVRRIGAGGSATVASPMSAGLVKLSMYEVRAVKEPQELTLPVEWSAFLGLRHVYTRAKAACVAKFAVLSTGGSSAIVAEVKRPKIQRQVIVRKSTDGQLHDTVSDILYTILLIMDDGAK
jgi:hypothetical protein